ncbi:4-carboxymuconolactone decarboxylase [Clostridium sp. MCC353]|uniref:carboxymuconolactone decarboxylase family protein n=1 Tax=Clostridium sp. MCC353 TaxID=2592646 RepID=UPI001C0381B2|nr:carboxymuconolactone decarboxylase family protein [Clostridium sp. MCC353]MBT9777353.1 4-carboxymuconolactone decarboxylase [Clostridium sp. MCC353]
MERNLKSSNTKKQLGAGENPLLSSDPDFAAIKDEFIFGEVYHHGTLEPQMKELLILVAVCTKQLDRALLEHTEIALHLGVEPAIIKEAIYQCAPYIGIGDVEEALCSVNRLFTDKGISLPLESRKTVTEEDREARGMDTRAAIFGKGTYTAVNHAPENLKHIQKYLCGYCFGDFYTRKGLDLKRRELLTLCMLTALGGCESQLKSHIKGNQAVGNTKSEMLEAVTICMPYIGFPRTLNAVACINETIPE